MVGALEITVGAFARLLSRRTRMGKPRYSPDIGRTTSTQIVRTPQRNRNNWPLLLTAMFAVMLLLATIILTGCGDKHHSTIRLRLYDPSGSTKARITESDIITDSVETTSYPKSSSYIDFRLTPNGAKQFRELTYAIARRGKRALKPQYMAFAVDGRLISRIVIDYKEYPHGLMVYTTTPVSIAVANAAAAKTLVRRIRAK